MELVFELDKHLNVSGPITDHANVVIFQLAARADDSAGGHVVFVDVVVSRAIFSFPELFPEIFTVPVKAHANGLVSPERILRVIIAEVQFEIIELVVKVLEAVI